MLKIIEWAFTAFLVYMLLRIWIINSLSSLGFLETLSEEQREQLALIGLGFIIIILLTVVTTAWIIAI